ncbi:DUF1223 domain-containing protein [Paracraurococcus ruber]|uniref:DUF1223 domain-containing protein n=1 Tax=Paracraurococcus ruber TaxID=77675 RepID=A0ABS1D089_9PROT|nr:DUF1223 domain-containing protein [Paracraurococcus ruber]MBK1660218.1 hypothetical protein [Paracraurococcus ruber]TDG29673.1 DUF1223 domain-containing protein [Paracraurococcus ruber]
MRRRAAMLALPLAFLARPLAAAPPGPVVVELFTSEGCSSCPPADAVLLDLAEGRPDVLALSWHVTYWDRLGWRDRFSLAEATARQRRYVAALRLESPYTPQAVVQGRRDVVGSDRRALLAAIAAAAPPAGPSLSLAAAGDQALAEIGAGAGEGSLWLIGYDARQATAVGAGENRGRRLVHANVVRAAVAAGAWRGAPASLALPRPAGERLALLLQAPDGAVLAAARA